MRELWRKRRILLLPLLPDPLWLGMVALDRVLSMGQIEFLNQLAVCEQINYV